MSLSTLFPFSLLLFTLMVMIEDGIPQPQRLKRLNEIAIHQMKILSSGTDGRNLLK